MVYSDAEKLKELYSSHKMVLKVNIIKKCTHDGCSNTAKNKGLSKHGFTKYSKYCKTHETNYYEKPYRLHKNNECSICGFIPVHKCQLDVDHIDGNKQNNNINNLQTLCANCHRLKTHLQKDYIKKPATKSGL